MTGMLHAIPKTPLHARLAAEGRLDPADQPEFGTNVIPLKIGREELRDGWFRVLNDLYQPEPYFARLDDLYDRGRLDTGRARASYWKTHPWERFKNEAIFLAQAVGLFFRLMTGVPEATLRREYRRRILRFARKSRDPGADPPLRRPRRHALPRLHDGDDDVERPRGAGQLVLNAALVLGKGQEPICGKSFLTPFRIRCGRRDSLDLPYNGRSP